MTKLRLSRVFMVMAAVFTLGACAGNPTPRSTAQYNDDASINNNVQAAVVSVPGVHANAVQISTYEGVVTLRGPVDDTLAAQHATHAARKVEGVHNGDYHLTLDSSGTLFKFLFPAPSLPN